MESTITLRSVAQRAAVKEVAPVPQKPLKKNNIVEITVYVDGREQHMRFAIPLGSSLIGSQRTEAAMTNIFTTMLYERFGKVTPV